MDNRPILSLAEIDAYDPQGPPARKWCPLCGESKPKDAAHRSLSIQRGNGLWKCFRCQASGQAREFWEEKPTFVSREALRRQLHAAFELGPPPSTSTPTTLPATAPEHSENTVPSTPASDWQSRWEMAQPLAGTPGATYLTKRGIPLEVAELAEVRWSPNWSGHGSVVFPIRGQRGETVAAQARAVRGNAKLTGGPKKDGAFFAPIGMGGGRVCSPFDAAVPAVILVEAPIDALSLAACGFPALALCGTSGPHWLRIACGLRRVALAFDADEAGDRAALALEPLLRPFGARCERLRPEGCKDWNEWLLSAATEELKDWLVARLLLS